MRYSTMRRVQYQLCRCPVKASLRQEDVLIGGLDTFEALEAAVVRWLGIRTLVTVGSTSREAL